MMQHRKASIDSGFTIVELLIVIVVIAILAAISIVAYTGIQERARSSQASTAIAQAKNKLELYKVDNGSYPASGDHVSAGIVDGETTFQYTSDGSSYCLTATAGTFSYKASPNSSSEQGGCPGHGQNGVAPVTNYADNPSFESNTSGWTENGGMPIVRTNEWSDSGSYSLRDTNTNGWSMQVRQTVGTPAIAGEVFSARATVRANVNPQTIAIWINWHNSSGSVISTTYGSNVNVPVGGTATLQVNNAIAPTGVSSARIRIYSATTAIGTTMNVDSVMLTKSTSSYIFADGGSPEWIWNGTPNNSTSTGPAL